MNNLKSIIKKYLEIPEYFKDIYRYHKYANFGHNALKNERILLSMISKYYHIVEKGLSMPNSRFGFGVEVLNRLINYCNEYVVKGYNVNSNQFIHAITTLNEYINFHDQNDYNIEKELKNKIIELSSKVNYLYDKPYKNQATLEDFFKHSNSSFEEFAMSRYSVRNYTEKNIDIEIIKKCIQIAQKSPSACNRQPNKVIIIQDKKVIEDVLSLQSGNRGFGNLSNKLLIVTSEISVFSRSLEKFGPHFNSGMFSMSLIYALHNQRIGCCALNWSTTTSRDKKLRKLLGIPKDEYITLIISCGYPPNNFKYAPSPRIDFHNTYKII